MGNRGTCSNTHYIRLDSLSDRVLNELRKLIRTAKNNDFWNKITAVKSVESQRTIQEIVDQQRKLDKRQNELRKYLATVYETR